MLHLPQHCWLVLCKRGSYLRTRQCQQLRDADLVKLDRYSYGVVQPHLGLSYASSYETHSDEGLQVPHHMVMS